ncbi:MAG: ATP-binding protein [Rhodocyclales bacterium]|nr:ATP-binding protein [Rhodocyclales bacterium]
MKKNKPSGPGSVAAKNYLTIAEINLPRLAEGDGRYRQNILNRANQRVSDDFAKFWSQVIGSKSRLSLKCSFEYYPASAGAKAGNPFLEFWIADGSTQLYPKQRSQGVRWFVSFYLQLRATEKRGSSRLFLLDEPGANLHDKAQEDVLRLIDQLRNEIPIIYSTHSPKMIEYEKIFRIRAIQRDSQHEDSPTVVIDAQHLGAASSDTLSPLLGAMGSDMSQQGVIKKKRNVLLEEISGYYYLKAFWNLQKRKEEAHFIAATGVNKIPLLANMFLGWGIEFVVAVDDDKQGREVFNQLKKDLCGDDSERARHLLLKFPECTSIEEAFSTADFKRLVLRDETAQVESGNSEYIKSAHISKPVTALTFMLSVNDGSITAESLDKETTTNIKGIVDAIVDLLKLHDISQKG